MVKEVVFAVPGDLGTPTGGYTYDRRIVAELPPGVGVEFLDGAPGSNQLARICATTGIAAAVGCHDEYPR